MRTRGVTIDNLDIKIHERYAKDQQQLDPKFITEARTIPPHSEINGTSSIYSSKWEELFELQIKNIPWAAFSPPPKYSIQPRKFFTYRLLPNISSGDEDEGEEKDDDKEREEEEKKAAKSSELIKTVLEAKKGEKGTSHAFEKDKSALLNLLESIKYLDKLLSQINSKKLQYQKG